MFDKFSDVAEKLATSVSRRAFLGRLGQGALATVGALTGFLVLTHDVSASSCPPGEFLTHCPNGGSMCCHAGKRCFCNALGTDCICAK